jgi:CrcB protein
VEHATRAVVLSIGGALGVNARYWLAVAIDRAAGTGFPWATLLINVTGAFVLGLLATLMARLEPHHPLRLLALVGFLGGYTTFSTFTLESHKLWESGQVGRALAYMAGSAAAGFVAVTLGLLLGRALTGVDGPYPQGAAAAGAGGMELAEVD